MTATASTRLLVLAAVGAVACARSIAPDKSDDTGSHSEISAGEAVIDATSDSNWAYLDLESATQPDPDTPEDSPDWDLGFRRYRIKINGGVSGTGGMEIVPLYGADYNDTPEVPDDGWVTDEPDDDDEDDLPEYAFDTWFDYDSTTHEVTPADIVYLVRTVEGNLFKLQILDYYDDAGTPAYIHLRWGPLDDTASDDTGGEDTGGEDGFACTADASKFTVTTGDDGVSTISADTSSEDEWVCWDMAALELVQADWDMAMLKWTFVLSGEGQKLEGADFDALTEAPADGWESDDGTGSVFVDWYDYDAENHTLVPQDAVYLVHTVAGGYYKMQMLSYYPEGDDSYEQPHHPSWRFAAIDPPAGR